MQDLEGRFKERESNAESDGWIILILLLRRASSQLKKIFSCSVFSSRREISGAKSSRASMGELRTKSRTDSTLFISRRGKRRERRAISSWTMSYRPWMLTRMTKQSLTGLKRRLRNWKYRLLRSKITLKNWESVQILITVEARILTRACPCLTSLIPSWGTRALTFPYLLFIRWEELSKRLPRL